MIMVFIHHNQKYFTTFMKFYQHKFVKLSSSSKDFRFSTIFEVLSWMPMCILTLDAEYGNSPKNKICLKLHIYR